MSLISLLTGRGSKLNDLELMLLGRLRQTLGGEPGEILRRQMEAIDYVNRMSGYREILCYRQEKSKTEILVPAFPARRAELKFASIRFTHKRTSQSWTAEFYLVRGHFFSIVFTPGAKPIKGTDEIQIEKVDLLVDPMKAIPERDTQVKPIALDHVKLPDWLEALRQEYSITDLFEPLPHERKTEALKSVNAALPEDYVALTDVTEGLVIENVSILGLCQVYETVMPDWNYYTIAEIHSEGILAVRAHGTEPELYFLDYEGALPRAIGTSIAHAVNTFLKLRE